LRSIVLKTVGIDDGHRHFGSRAQRAERLGSV
jgi:hypothetical protein